MPRQPEGEKARRKGVRKRQEPFLTPRVRRGKGVRKEEKVSGTFSASLALCGKKRCQEPFRLPSPFARKVRGIRRRCRCRGGRGCGRGRSRWRGRCEDVGFAAGVERAAQAADVASTVRSSTSWFWPQTRSSSWSREKTRPGLCRSWRSRRNSVGLEVDLALAARDPVGDQVHREVGKPQDLGGEGRAHAAQHGAHARDQLLDRERLGDVVVGAGIEAAEAVRLLAARGQHDDRQVARSLSCVGAGGRPRGPTSTAASSRAARDRAGARR